MTWHPDKKQGDELVKRVLSQTSGSACTKAQGFLPELVSGKLEGMDADLVKSHVQHCRVCQGLVRTLGWLDGTLPGMAQLDPGPGFTRAVLQATSRAADEKPAAVEGLMTRLRSWWQGQLLRPGFTAELAYVATVVVVLLTAIPGAPLESAPRKAQQIIKAGPTALPVVGDLLAPTAEKVAGWASSSGHSVGTKVQTGWETTAGSLPERSACSRPALVRLTDALSEGLEQAGQGQLADAWRSAGEAFAAAAESWRLWWNECE